MKQLAIVIMTIFIAMSCPIEITAGNKVSKLANNIYFEGQNNKKLEGIGKIILKYPKTKDNKFMEISGNFSTDYIYDCTVTWRDGTKLSSPKAKYHISKNGSSSEISLELTPYVHIDIPTTKIDGYLLNGIKLGFKIYGKGVWEIANHFSDLRFGVQLTYSPIIDNYINSYYRYKGYTDSKTYMGQLRGALREEAKNITKVDGEIILKWSKSQLDSGPRLTPKEIYAKEFTFGDGYATLSEVSRYGDYSGSFHIYHHINNNKVVFSSSNWDLNDISINLSDGTLIDIKNKIFITFPNGDKFKGLNLGALSCTKFIGACSDENDVKPYDGVLRHPSATIDDVFSNGEIIKKIVKSNCTLIIKDNSIDVEFNDGSKFIGDGLNSILDNYFWNYHHYNSEFYKSDLKNGKLIHADGSWEQYRDGHVVDSSKMRSQPNTKSSKQTKSNEKYHDKGKIETCPYCNGSGLAIKYLGQEQKICRYCGGKGWYIEHYW